MTNPTPHGQVPAIQRYKIGYHSDEWGVRSNTPGGIPDPAGSWVLYEDHLAALVEAQQPTQAQAGAVPLTDEQIEALPMWRRFVGLWPETRREIVQTIEHQHGIKGGQHGTE